MAMKYDEALKEWGVAKLKTIYGDDAEIDRGTVNVVADFDDGYGGCDTCGTSYPSSEIIVTALGSYTESYYWTKETSRVERGKMVYELDLETFDFFTFLNEVVEAGNGTIEA